VNRGWPGTCSCIPFSDSNVFNTSIEYVVYCSSKFNISIKFPVFGNNIINTSIEYVVADIEKFNNRTKYLQFAVVLAATYSRLVLNMLLPTP
jgi:hypothetical protein